MYEASRFQVPDGLTGEHAVSLERNDREVLKAKRKAKFWLLPVGFCRPLPMGNAVRRADMKTLLGMTVSDGPLECSEWEGVCAEETGDISGVFARYYFNPAAPPGDGQNVNSMLMTSTLFDIPVIMEFQ